MIILGFWSELDTLNQFVQSTGERASTLAELGRKWEREPTRVGRRWWLLGSDHGHEERNEIAGVKI